MRLNISLNGNMSFSSFPYFYPIKLYVGHPTHVASLLSSYFYASELGSGYPSQKSKPRFNWEKARFNWDEYNFNGINQDLSEILS